MAFDNEQLWALQPRRQDVPMPELGAGEKIVMIEANGPEAEGLLADVYQPGPDGLVANPDGRNDARWIAASAHNENGTRRFTANDLDRIMALPGHVRMRLYLAAVEVNRDEAGAAVKNS